MLLHHVRAASFALLALYAEAAPAETRILDRETVVPHLKGRHSDFLAVDLTSDTRCELSGSDLASRHAPWSTFKIPNFLIALMTGAAEGPDHMLEWDPKRRPAAAYWPEDWQQDQALTSAFKRSAVWYFQDVAAIVGGPTYRKILSSWNYGNAEAPDGDDGFWLAGPLAISVEEQVSFISALLEGKLDVSQDQLEALWAVSDEGVVAGGVLHGKTGSGPVEAGNFDGAFEGWYVGWLVRPTGQPLAFAHYVRAERYADIRTYRKDEALSLLDACHF